MLLPEQKEAVERQRFKIQEREVQLKDYTNMDRGFTF